jgi:hypothetical protein
MAALVGAPSVASAQFTTFIPPKNTVADSVKAIVATQQKVAADSITHAQITNMQTWVDSAAGVAPRSMTGADTLAGAAGTVASADTTTFVNGTRAPETASDLPLLALMGAMALLLGTVLLAGGRPTTARKRIT